jgi:hypothetical protein
VPIIDLLLLLAAAAAAAAATALLPTSLSPAHHSCPKNYICKAESNAPLRCPNKLVTKSKGAKNIRDCVNPRGYYYKPAGNTRTSPQQQQLDTTTAAGHGGITSNPAAPATAAAAALDAAAYAAEGADDDTSDTPYYPFAIPCSPDTWSNGFDFQSKCTPCPPDLKTDPEAPYGSAASIAACLAPPGTYLHSANSTVVPCEVGSYSDDYSNHDSCKACEDVLGPTGRPLGPGIVTAGSGSNSSAACRVLEPGFVLVDVKGLAILQPLQVNQVREVL